MEEMVEALRRIEVKLSELTEKVDRSHLQPRAYSKRDAARLLGRGLTSLREMIRSGKLKTVEGGLIPLSEIVRLTSVKSPSGSAPTLRPRSSDNWKTEVAKTRARLTARRGRR